MALVFSHLLPRLWSSHMHSRAHYSAILFFRLLVTHLIISGNWTLRQYYHHLVQRRLFGCQLWPNWKDFWMRSSKVDLGDLSFCWCKMRQWLVLCWGSGRCRREALFCYVGDGKCLLHSRDDISYISAAIQRASGSRAPSDGGSSCRRTPRIPPEQPHFTDKLPSS